MSYKRTQIYLDPDDHRRLGTEARRRGMSMTALLREIVHEHVATGAPKRRDGFQGLIGIIDAGDVTDAARELDEDIGSALDARYDKKMGRVGDVASPRRDGHGTARA